MKFFTQKVYCRVAALYACLFLFTSCTSSNKEPEFFLPEIINPHGESLEDARKKLCAPAQVSFRDGILTEQNIYNVFSCVNYDRSLEGLRPLFESGELKALLTNLNSLIGTPETKTIHEILDPWFIPEDGAQSKIDRLLPVLSSTIKNKAFQEGIPIISNILEAGNDSWEALLPALADLLYTPRFPDNFEDILLLWQAKNSSSVPDVGENKKTEADPAQDPQYAKSLKKVALLLSRDFGGKTGARLLLELLHDADRVKLPGSSVTAFLDQANIKNVFLSMYQESGRLRGEKIDPKLNADPDQDELELGLTLTPEQRQERMYRKLFSSENGEAPILQLSRLVAEFHTAHPNFMPALSNWYSAHGDRVKKGLTNFVGEMLVVDAIPQVNIQDFLTTYLTSQGKNLSEPVEAPAFVQILKEAYASIAFEDWLLLTFQTVNREHFGPNNEKSFRESKLKENTLAVYRLAPVAEFGKNVFPRGKPLPLASAIRSYSNLHRKEERLQVSYQDKIQGIEKHMTDFWLDAMDNYLGENIVLNRVLELTQTFLNEFATNFAKDNPDLSLAQWYFSSTYSSPSASESMAVYAFKTFNLMESYEKNKGWLKDTFAVEAFRDQNDIRAFRLLVDQIPNIYMYIRSGMSRSGNDLSRSLSEKDRGYLIRSYVQLLVSATNEGVIAKAVPLLSAYQNMEDLSNFAPEEPPADSLEDRVRISAGSDALKRVLNSLFRPEVRGKYETALLPQVLVPLTSLVSDSKIDQTEKFILVAADEVLRAEDTKLNNFFSAFGEVKPGNSLRKNRSTAEAAAELLKKKEAPQVVRQFGKLFKEDAVKPSLDYLATKIDDGTLDRILAFLSRILGIKK